MQLKALASTIALATALAISGPVYAQSMINGMTIPDDELAAVQERCDELKLAADTEPLASEGTEGEEEVDNAGDAEVEDAPETEGTDEATTTVIDLDTIDLQACIDAGLVME